MPIATPGERGCAWFAVGPVLAAMLVAGCSATITPPPTAERPKPIFLLDHGRSASLVLPRDEGLARWAYGDWDWYARMRTGSGAGMRALFASSRGTLGRYRLEGPATPASVDRQVDVPIQRLFEIAVDQAQARALDARLEALFATGREAAIYNGAYQLEFVPHPDPYTLGHNSNHVVADWLRELGCTVEGDPALGKWRIRGLAPSGR
jgi:hypothetical protein